MAKETVVFTEQNKESIIETKKLEGYRLVEVQRHVDRLTGQYENFLVFDNEPPKPEPLSLEQRVSKLEEVVAKLPK